MKALFFSPKSITKKSYRDYLKYLAPSRITYSMLRYTIRHLHLNQTLLNFVHPAGARHAKYNKKGEKISIFSRGLHPNGAPKPSEHELHTMQNNTIDWQVDKHLLIHHHKGQIECFVQHRTKPGKAMLIAFSGNGQCFTQPRNHQEALAQIRLTDNQHHLSDTTIILVNHPGVGNSAFYGRARQSVEDLTQSAWIATQWILKTSGTSAEHVSIFGHSLGGVVASWVAYQCHQQHQTVHVCISRSLASSSTFLYAHFPKLVSMLFWMVIPLSYLTHTHMNSARYYYKIPESYRFAFEAEDDELMKPSACLSQHWRRPRHDQSVMRLSSIELSTENMENLCAHNQFIDLHKLYRLKVKPSFLLESS